MTTCSSIRSRIRFRLAAALAALLLGALPALSSLAAAVPAVSSDHQTTAREQTAVFAGGCFWGMDAVFKRVKGVTKVVSGYSGGTAATAHYELVSTGTTGQAESVKVTYDPSRISYQTLLKVFFLVAHNPTELDRQGPDYGKQYRSVVFFASERQEKEAKAYIAELEKQKVFSDPIVTRVVPLKAFYPAEAYHQNFFEKHPEYPYIVINDVPKIAELREKFPNLYQPYKP